MWLWYSEDLWPYYSSNGYEYNPLTYQEISEWAKLTGRIVTPQEVKLLKRIDSLWRVESAKKRPGKSISEKGEGTVVSQASLKDDPQGVRGLLRRVAGKFRKNKSDDG